MWFSCLFLLIITSCTLENANKIEFDEIENWLSYEPISVLLVIDKNCKKCDEYFKIWDGLEDIFKGYASFAIMDASSKSPSYLKGSKYPLVKIFQKDLKTPTTYSQSITADGLMQYILGLMDKSIKSKYKSKGFSSKDSFITILDDKNFTNFVQNSDEHYLVEFFAPWCGHCKALKPTWELAAKQLYDKIKLVTVDATVNKELASRFKIQGFPTIKYFPSHTKDLDNGVIDYNGGRTLNDIVNWVENKLDQYAPLPELMQLTSPDQLEDECFGKRVCILAVLPNRLDSSSSEWKKYIGMLGDVVSSLKNSEWGWLWCEGGVYESLEEVFGIGGFGYPALAAINYDKKAYSVMKSSFSTTNIKKFLNSLSSKSVITEKITKDIPQIKLTQKWDESEFTKSEL